MFKNPFSFNGRIRRLEFGLSYIIYFVVLFVIGMLIGTMDESTQSIITFIVYIPLLWFCLAQGSKRCHDVDSSGWMQIVPFYVFWLLFQDGTPGRNEYGPNPKNLGEADVLESETLDGHLRN